MVSAVLLLKGYQTDERYVPTCLLQIPYGGSV